MVLHIGAAVAQHSRARKVVLSVKAQGQLGMVAHRLTPAQETKACSLYKHQHRTLRELALLYDLSPAGIRKILIRNNVALRPKKELGVKLKATKAQKGK